jgi:hypothetical protein
MRREEAAAIGGVQSSVRSRIPRVPFTHAQPEVGNDLPVGSHDGLRGLFECFDLAGRLDRTALPDQITGIHEGGVSEFGSEPVDVTDRAKSGHAAQPAGLQSDSSPTATEVFQRIRDVDGNLPDVLRDVGLWLQPDVFEVGIPLGDPAEEVGNHDDRLSLERKQIDRRRDAQRAPVQGVEPGEVTDVGRVPHDESVQLSLGHVPAGTAHTILILASREIGVQGGLPDSLLLCLQHHASFHHDWSPATQNRQAHAARAAV